MKFSKAKPREDGTPQGDIAVPAFGYKNHISSDRRHGLIRRWTATDAAAHDGARLNELIDQKNTARDLWADTSYRSVKNEALLLEGEYALSVDGRADRLLKPGDWFQVPAEVPHSVQCHTPGRALGHYVVEKDKPLVTWL